MTHLRGADAPTWRFRRLAALYPSSWLAEQGDAYVGTMLDVADAEGRTGPVGREWISAMRHAARVWADELGRRVRAERGLRSFGLVGQAAVVSGSALALLSLVFGELAPPWLLPGGPPAAFSRQGVHATTGLVLFVLWITALALVAAGRKRTARRALGAAAVTPAVLYALRAAGGPDRPPAGMLLAMTVFAVLATTVPEPSRRGRVALVIMSGLPAVAGGAWILAAWAAWPYRRVGLAPLGFGFYRGGGLPLFSRTVVVVVLVTLAATLLLVPWRAELFVCAGLVGTGWLWLALSTPPFYLPGRFLVAHDGLVTLAVLTGPGLLASLVAAGVGGRRLLLAGAGAPTTP